MRLRLLKFSGIIKSEYLRAGEIHEVPEELAVELLKRGRAERVETVETTAAAPPENAALRTKPPVHRKVRK